MLGKDGGLGFFEDAVDAPQDGEGEDDFAVVGLFVIAAKEIGDGPEERGKVGFRHEGMGSGHICRQSGFGCDKKQQMKRSLRGGNSMARPRGETMETHADKEGFSKIAMNSVRIAA
nr:hypothetical protein [Ereboglobus luteus]